MINAKQIRAARAILGWSQQDLADAIGMSKPTIVEAEKDGHQPRLETTGLIQAAFEDKGLDFIVGGVKERDDILTVFEGDDCYVQLIDTIHRVLTKSTSGEVLYYAADESRTPKIIKDKNIQLLKSGISRRLLIRPGDTYILGDINDYKWMPEKLWLNSDVKIIFDEYVAYFVSWQSVKKVFLLRDANISFMEKGIFSYIWDLSMTPTHSSVERVYFSE
ncbi:MAG: helix-turn-helix transcriptional regulator [Rhodospirillales bacterium]|nr:helix-turn-helix transcriptional regulator [Rhodospirillales bacterium]